MKSITTVITEARKKGTPLTHLHFDNASAAWLFYGEMSGQISDGKYENSKPANHWMWVTNVDYIIDGEEWYGGSPRRIKYNLNEWPGYIKKADESEEGNKKWGWARRILDYGRIGVVLGKEKTEDALNQNDGYDGAAYGIRNVAELWGDALRANPDATLDDVEVGDYQQKYVDKSGIWNKSMFNKFKKTEYTMRELKADLRSMEATINTDETQKY